MAITWRQHVKNTMAKMGKETHLKDVLKMASKSWKSVKSGAVKAEGAVEGAILGKTKHHRRHTKAAKKSRKQRTRKNKTSRRGKRGGTADYMGATENQGKGLTPAAYPGGSN